ncbi:amino acid ABC transporter permease [Streptomyces sp. NPDC004069]
MNTVLTEYRGLLWSGFLTTVELSVLAALVAFAVGAALAVARVSPVGPLRTSAAVYVQLVRNTPLTVVFFLIVFAAPQVDLAAPSYFLAAVGALGLYTAAFVGEALRSGINAVGSGQGEAARALGLRFGQTMRHIVLPQAARAVLPPLGSTWIALVKNSSIAAGFAVTELTATSQRIAFLAPQAVLPALLVIALAYLLITVPSGLAVEWYERRTAAAA